VATAVEKTRRDRGRGNKLSEGGRVAGGGMDVTPSRSFRRYA